MARNSVELNKLSEKSLAKLREDIDGRLAELQKERIEEARKDVSALLMKKGLTLQEVYPELLDQSGRKKIKKARTKAPPKYQHPEDATVTWTGRGRRPRWVEDILKKGGALEDIAIA